MQETELYKIKYDKIVLAVKEILLAIGEDGNREGLKETPHRVAKMYLDETFVNVECEDDDIVEMLSKTFSNDTEDCNNINDMVIVKDIPLYSTCEHHLVPFYGKAHIGYVPSDKVVGISKIARLVEMISKRPQLQERITQLTADLLIKMIDPKGVMVVIEAEHLCMSSRGVRKPGSKTVTSAARGCFMDDQATRSEFLSFIK